MLTRRDALGALGASALAAPNSKPNLILIYADDLGFGDLGCYGGPIRTPNLDRMAAEGMRFTQFLSANPVCSPSRASLLTGRYPTRVGVPRVLFPYDNSGLAEGEQTIGHLVQAKGYKTMCVGKWHLGHHEPHLPPHWGFDEYFGIPYSNDMVPRPLLHATRTNVETLEEQATLETLTPRYTEQAVRFIDNNKDNPFFLYMPHTYPHIPLAASAKFRGKSAQGLYGDVVEELDWSVGQILDRLRQHKLDRNTMVVFSSDNGPWYQGSAGILRGRKGSTHEGGVRVPMIAWMPGKVARGRTSNALSSTMDILPTFAKLTSASLPSRPLDGIDLWPVLSGKQNSIEREALLYFDYWNAQCIRKGNYKLHVARYNSQVYSPAPPGGRINLPLPHPELYDLSVDPAESYDIAPEKPELVKELMAKFESLVGGFPEGVTNAWAETKARKTVGNPAAFPRLAK